MIKYLSLLKSFKEEYILCDIAHMAAADNVFGGDLFCAAVSHTLWSWIVLLPETFSYSYFAILSSCHTSCSVILWYRTISHLVSWWAVQIMGIIS